MPVDSAALLKGLKPILKALDADLLKRAKDPGVEAAMRVSWKQEREASRTGDAFGTWQRRRCHQVSIAWILSVVFVRTLEDRGLISHKRIAAEGAADSEAQFFALAPYLTARDYLLFVFRELASLPGAADLFDARHNPVWVLAPSDGGAKRLLDFFRRPDAKGNPPPEFSGEDTRFLGDLYQDLSEDVRKRYALLQTPEFVEEFILEQTLDPAVQEFGLDEVRLIDPTCGSGHFLLGAFQRLYGAWLDRAPGEDRQVLAQRALAQVFGCDLNPYAVAIARFRLTLNFLQTAGIDRLERAPRLQLNLCVADSLLHGVAGQQQRLAGVVGVDARKTWGEQLFALEDENEALRILGQRYHAVVGNPPYITEKDAKKRAKYRDLYTSAAGKYALAAPFTERFFGLAVQAGFVGLINANSFTKRDFGKALIEQVLPELDVVKVVDTSGTYIPGYGTPTLLLFGRNREAGADDVVAVLGKRGEAEQPDDPATAPVWAEIIGHHEEIGFDGRHVSVEAIPRDEMAEHPWVLAGGGARKLKETVETTTSSSIDEWTQSVGVAAFTLLDDVYVSAPHNLMRNGVESTCHRPWLTGEDIRDWSPAAREHVLFPYDAELAPIQDLRNGSKRFMWPYRTLLAASKMFGGKTKVECGLRWYEFGRLTADKLRTPLSISFAFVSTHNHFILDRGGRVFNRHAPIIKLKEQYDEDDHLALLGLLNSSVACFWMKMVFFDKGSSSGGTIRRESWEPFFEFDGTKMKKFPVARAPEVRDYAAQLDTIATARRQDSAEAVLVSDVWLDRHALVEALNTRRQRDLERLERMVGLQEELDWLCYRIYGLDASIRVLDVTDEPRLRPGHRPFELDMAADGEPTDWFSRHGWEATDTLPASYEDDYCALIAERRQLTADVKALQLAEQPNFKRRWYHPDFDEEEKAALRAFLLNHIESPLDGHARPAVTSARQLAAELGRDPRATAVAEVYTGESAPDLERLVSDLVKAEAVPYLSALRFTDTGLEKHAAWRETWDLQRREDASEDVGDIPVPPKYATGDFRGSYWTHRGKLDVPKERFVLLLGAETENDTSPWIGWAGWDHLQRATALSGLYQQRKTEEGWGPDKLIPLLAGLHELVPWLIQWHNDPDPNFGGQRLGDFFRDFVAGEVQQLGLHLGLLDDWRPTAPTTRRTSTASTGTGTRGRTTSLTPETLLAAIERLQGDGDVNLAQLSTDLDVSKQTVSKVAKACVEAGELEQTSGRPLRFRRA